MKKGKTNNPDGRPVERTLEKKRLKCTNCGKTKNADKFAIVGPLKNRRHSWCDACNKVYQRQMYMNRAKRLAQKGLASATKRSKA